MSVSLNTNVTQVANTQTVKPSETKTDDKSKFLTPTQTKVAIGTGLAALAAVGIYLATRGKNTKATSEVTTEITQGSVEQLKNLQEQAKQLKTEIKNAYLEKLSKHCPAEELTLLAQDGLKSIAGHENQRYIRSSKDWKLIKEYLMNLGKDMSPTESCSVEFYYPAKARRDMLSLQIKNRLKDLQTDKDWIELRKVRKVLLKDLKLQGKNSEEGKVIRTQIADINEILKSKVLNIQDDYNKFHTMNIDDASKRLKKRYKTFNEYTTVYSNGYKGDQMGRDDYISRCNILSLGGYRPLTINNMFTPQEIKLRDVCIQIKDMEKVFNGCDEQALKTREFLKELAHEFRGSEDSKRLKEINRQIAELKKKK